MQVMKIADFVKNNIKTSDSVNMLQFQPISDRYWGCCLNTQIL